MDIEKLRLQNFLFLVEDWNFSLLADERNIRLWNMDEAEKTYRNLRRVEPRERLLWLHENQRRYYDKLEATGRKKTVKGYTTDYEMVEYKVNQLTDVGPKDPKPWVLPAGTTIKITGIYLPEYIGGYNEENNWVRHERNVFKFSIIFCPFVKIVRARFIALAEEVKNIPAEIVNVE